MPVKKDEALRQLESIDDEGSIAMKIAKLAVELKVVLLADVDFGGGLNPDNRRRAWDMVNEICKLVRE
jgi:hypothetical protein